MFLGKRGDSFMSLEAIVELILAAVIIFAAVAYVNNQIGDGAYQKEFYSKDAALLMDVIEGAPGDISFHYDMTNEHDIQLVFSKTSVATSEIDGPIAIETPYANNPFLPLNATNTTTSFTINKTDTVKFNG